MLTSLFSIQFIVLAIFINMFVYFTMNSIKDVITKGKGEDSNFGLPPVVVRNMVILFIFILSFGSTWLLVYLQQMVLISNSIFLTSGWGAVLATLTYNIGVKELMSGLKGIMKNKLNIK